MQKLTNFKFQSVMCKLLSAIFLSVCIIFSICVYRSFAEVPCKINYQGRLIKDNVPVNEPVNMEFKLYTQETEGEPIKTITINNVPVHNGLFRVVLDLEGINWAAGETIYLEVKAGTDTLTPREPIYAYPYAINSHLLEGSTKEYFLNVSDETQKKEGGLNIMGDVGIGTTEPKTKLDVDGLIRTARYSLSGDNGPTPPAPSLNNKAAMFYNLDNDTMHYSNGTAWMPMGGESFGNRSVLAEVSTTVNAGTKNIDVAASSATTAGEFICVVEWTGADGDQTARAVGYSDSNPDPSTVLGHATVDWSYNQIRWASYSFIVKKGDYYKAEWKGVRHNNAPVTRTYYWLPIGD